MQKKNQSTTYNKSEPHSWSMVYRISFLTLSFDHKPLNSNITDEAITGNIFEADELKHSN